MKTYLVLVLLLLSLVPAFAQEDSSDIDLTPPEFGSFDPESIADIHIEDYPILPELTDHARIIFERGKETGRNPQVFSKVGDCMTASEPFLTPFGGDDYDLGEYTHLAEVVEHFSSVPARGEGFEQNAFSAKGLATETGYNTASALDSIWSDPNWCDSSESPLECEYRVTSSAFSLIMFGTNDVQFINEADFDYYLRNVIIETINHDVVPVLYTFPDRPEFLEKSDRYNQIIIKVAEDYDLPLINFWLSLKDLPDSGVDVLEPIHLTLPEDGNTGIFTEERLNMGYTHRNLVTLQALDILLQGLIEDDETESVSS